MFSFSNTFSGTVNSGAALDVLAKEVGEAKKMVYFIEVSRLRPASNSFNLFRIKFDAVFAHNVAQISLQVMKFSAYTLCSTTFALVWWITSCMGHCNW